MAHLISSPTQSHIIPPTHTGLSLFLFLFLSLSLSLSLSVQGVGAISEALWLQLTVVQELQACGQHQNSQIH